MPQIGRIEISIIEESQSEILAFTQGNLDLVALCGDDTKRVIENGKLRPELAKRYPARSLWVAECDVHVFQF